MSPTPHEQKSDARSGLNFDLPENDFKTIQGASFTLSRPMRFSFKHGSKIVSVNLPYAEITKPKIRAEQDTTATKRTVAQLTAKRLAEQKYEADFGMRDLDNETVIIRHDKDSVTYELIWQPPEDTRRVEVNL